MNKRKRTFNNKGKRTAIPNQLKDDRMRTYFNTKEVKSSKLKSRFKRLKRRERLISHSNNPRNRAYRKIKRILFRFKSSYSIPFYIISSTFNLYKRLRIDGFVKNQRIKETTIALLYYKCHKNQIILRLEEMCNFTEAKKNVAFKLYQQILRDLNVKPPRVKILIYVDYCCNKLNSHFLKLDILKFLKRLNPNFQGKNPINVLGALIYIISKKKDINLTYKHIAEKIGTSRMSIQNNVHQF